MSHKKSAISSAVRANQEPKLALSAIEMARRLGVHERTLLRSTVPRTRVGRRILFLPDLVYEHLATNQEVLNDCR